MRHLGLVCACMVSLSGCWLFHRGPEDVERSVTAPEWDVPPDAGVGDARCVERNLRAGERFEPVDMVWVVDSSRSMADEQARIEQTMNEFVRDAEQRNFDVRLIMITDVNIVPPPLGRDADRYLFVAREVASRAPLQALLDELPRYEQFLRPEARLHFVIVTDDESELDGGSWVHEMDRRLGREYVVHAVASPDVDGLPCRNPNAIPEQCSTESRSASRQCGAASIGRVYYALAEQSGGERISICIDDWREVFGPLLEAVTPTEIPCAIELPTPADFEADLSTTRVELQLGGSALSLNLVPGPNTCGTQRGYYYVDRPDTVVLALCPSACEATRTQGVTLRIATDCDPLAPGPD